MSGCRDAWKHLPAIAQLVERSTVDRLVGCSIHPRRIYYWDSNVLSICHGTLGVVVTFLPSKEEPRFRLPEGAVPQFSTFCVFYVSSYVYDSFSSAALYGAVLSCVFLTMTDGI